MGIFSFFKKKNTASITDEERHQFAVNMLANASVLVQEYKGRFNLDFSVASLHALDEILEEIAVRYNTRMNKDEQEIIITKAGSYIFEVAKQNFGGRYFWYAQLNQPILVTGQPEFEMSLLAYEKVKGRLVNGMEDNIPFFFQGFVDGVEMKNSAMIV